MEGSESKQSSDQHRDQDEHRRDEDGERHHHHHHKSKKKSKKKKHDAEKSSNEERTREVEQITLLEEKIQAKQRADMAGSSKSGGGGAQGADAAQRAALLDARIDAKRAANAPVNMGRSEPETRAQAPEVNNSGVDDQLHNTEKGGAEEKDEEMFLLAEKSDHEKNFEVGPDRPSMDSLGIHSQDDVFREQGRDDEEDNAYPNVEADVGVMAEVDLEGLVDEAGGIQAYVAEPTIVEGDVIGVIKSDDEVEREERRVYIKYFSTAVACLVFLIVIIGVPVTLKLTKVIGKTVVLTPDPTMSPTSMPSESPSGMPSSEHFTQVVEKLSPLSRDMLLVPGSHQHRAARWISDVDQFDIDDPGFEQRYVMALFYYATGGPDWSSQDGWLGEDSVCTWEGIKGLSNCLSGCISRNGYDMVCGITMKYNRISGSLPSEMGLLTEMRYFEIQNNNIVGTIPSELGNWNKMTAFLVNWNNLEGSLPSSFTNNKLLGTIFLNGNRLNGTFFSDSVAGLSGLKWLEARENSFSGSLSGEIANLTKLETFDLRNNRLSGYIPDAWTETNIIESFMISFNNFTGKLPETLGNAPFLEKLHISSNSITGSIPASYYGMENLEELYLDGNNIGGGLPQDQVPFYGNMEAFSIHNNTFQGRFPVEHFEESYTLKLLSLHGNQLTGTITDAICDRRDTSQANSLKTLTVDCDLIECDCCTCY